MTDAVGKPCPVCSSPMVNLMSQFVRLCSNNKCGHWVEWNLNPGQKPLLGSNRA